MAEVSVENGPGDDYRVTVLEEGSKSTHTVTVTDDALARYGGGASANELVEASFHFLLDREPKESILGHFDLPVIEQYFSEYPDRIGDYL